MKLGPSTSPRPSSYLWAAVKPKGKEDTFEEWVSNRFGRWLFNQFFKSYTEKVWGVPDVRDPRRLGGPAHQEPVVLPRRQVGVLRQQATTSQVA